jgi:predicted nucleic acid-binding protein
MIYWDTSALVLCYEPRAKDHSRARNLLLREKHVACALIQVEAVSAVVRRLGDDKRKAKAILDKMEEHLRHFVLVPLGEEVLEKAAAMAWAHRLRAADAIHVAAARNLARDLGRASFRVATSDIEQAAAARAEGLRVIDLQA